MQFFGGEPKDDVQRRDVLNIDKGLMSGVPRFYSGI